eukprot:446854-Rhodomonas_salina.1
MLTHQQHIPGECWVISEGAWNWASARFRAGIAVAFSALSRSCLVLEQRPRIASGRYSQALA